jgi:hypothetical protein
MRYDTTAFPCRKGGKFSTTNHFTIHEQEEEYLNTNHSNQHEQEEEYLTAKSKKSNKYY